MTSLVQVSEGSRQQAMGGISRSQLLIREQRQICSWHREPCRPRPSAPPPRLRSSHLCYGQWAHLRDAEVVRGPAMLQSLQQPQEAAHFPPVRDGRPGPEYTRTISQARSTGRELQGVRARWSWTAGRGGDGKGVSGAPVGPSWCELRQTHLSWKQ